MMNRFAETQVWPELPMRLAYAAFTACSIFASLSTTKGSEPPSSKQPFFICLAHWTATLVPPRVLPVNLQARTRLSARMLEHYSSLANRLMKSPVSNPASIITSCRHFRPGRDYNRPSCRTCTNFCLLRRRLPHQWWEMVALA